MTFVPGQRVWFRYFEGIWTKGTYVRAQVGYDRRPGIRRAFYLPVGLEANDHWHVIIVDGQTEETMFSTKDCIRTEEQHARALILA